MVFRTTLLQHCYSVLYQQDLQVFYASLNCRHPFLKLSVFFDQRSVELFVRNISPNFEQILTKRLERRIQSTKVLYELGQILVFNVTTSSHHILQIFVQARRKISQVAMSSKIFNFIYFLRNSVEVVFDIFKIFFKILNICDDNFVAHLVSRNGLQIVPKKLLKSLRRLWWEPWSWGESVVVDVIKQQKIGHIKSNKLILSLVLLRNGLIGFTFLCRSMHENKLYSIS